MTDDREPGDAVWRWVIIVLGAAILVGILNIGHSIERIRENGVHVYVTTNP